MNKKRRIVIISAEFSPLTNWGGIARFNHNLAGLLSSLEFEVHVIAAGLTNKTILQESYILHYVSFRSTSKLVNFLYYYFPFGPIHFCIEKFFPELCNTIDWNFFSMIVFSSLNKKNGFDFIHTPSYKTPGFLVKLLYPKIPLINHLHGPQVILNNFENKSLETRILAKLEILYLYFCSNKIISCSNDLKNKFIRMFPQFTNRIQTIHNFIDIKKYRNNEKIELNNIVYFGRLEFRKGVDLLIRAFVKLAQKNKKINLYLIGEDSHNLMNDKRKIFSTNDLLNSIDVNIRARIFVYPRIDDLNSLIKILSKIKGIAMLPSRYEPFGFTVIEAMSIGFITVASSRGGASEIIANNISGFIVEPNVTNIAQCIAKIQAMEPNQISKIVRNSLITTEKEFSYSKVKQIYARLLS